MLRKVYVSLFLAYFKRLYKCNELFLRIYKKKGGKLKVFLLKILKSVLLITPQRLLPAVKEVV